MRIYIFNDGSIETNLCNTASTEGIEHVMRIRLEAERMVAVAKHDCVLEVFIVKRRERVEGKRIPLLVLCSCNISES